MGFFQDPLGSIKSELDDFGDSIRGARDDLFSGDILGAIGKGFGGFMDLSTLGLFDQAKNAILDFAKPDIPPREFTDRKVMSRGTEQTRRFIYGQARLGGSLVYTESSGSNAEVMHIIVAFAAHQCEELGDIYFDDDLVFSWNGSSHDIQSKFSGLVTMYYELGDHSVANTDIVSNTPDTWTSNHKLLGICHAYFKLTYSDEVFRGLPNISAVIKGKNDLYDPRDESTGYSDNQALCVLDYLRWEKGSDIDDSLINMASFSTGANLADELVASGPGTTEVRYTVNGSSSFSNTPPDNLRALLKAGASTLVETQGIWYFIGGEYGTPTSYDFNEDDLISDLNIQPVSSKNDAINYVKGKFIDPTQDYNVVEFKHMDIDAYETADGETLEADVTYNFTNSSTMARRLSKILIENNRFGIGMTVTLKYNAMNIAVGDLVAFTISGLGWSSKIFRVMEVSISIQGGVTLGLKEDSEDIWSWEEGDALAITQPPAVTLPDPSVVVAPTGLSINETIFYSNVVKGARVRLDITWDYDNVGIRNYELEGSFNGEDYQVFGNYVIDKSMTVYDLTPGAWNFRVRAVNSLGFKSSYHGVNYTVVGKTAPPEAVSTFAGVTQPTSIKFTWSPVADIDIEAYEIRLGSSWETGIVIQSLLALEWTWETRPTGTENVWIKALDTSGNYSEMATAAGLTINNPSIPSGFKAQVVDNNILFTWNDATTSFFIKEYVITKGTIFNTSTELLRIKGTSTVYFETQAGTDTYWLYAVDIAGNVGSPTSRNVSVDDPPDFVINLNSQLDLSTYDSASNLQLQISDALTIDSDQITIDSTEILIDQKENYSLIGPVDVSTTWQQLFESVGTPVTIDSDIIKIDNSNILVSDGIINIQSLIDAGYELYGHPSASSADWEATYDIGAELAVSKITINPVFTDISGTVTKDWTIGYSDDDVSYTSVSGTSTVAKNFRYVKITLNLTALDTKSLTKLDSLFLRLDTKVKTDEGAGTASSGDSGGTTVSFNKTFADINSLVVTPNATTAVYTLVDFDDTPNPTTFKVLMFDSGGTRASGNFYWTARGV